MSRRYLRGIHSQSSQIGIGENGQNMFHLMSLETSDGNNIIAMGTILSTPTDTL